jgi:hypothetical protein
VAEKMMGPLLPIHSREKFQPNKSHPKCNVNIRISIIALQTPSYKTVVLATLVAVARLENARSPICVTLIYYLPEYAQISFLRISVHEK